MFGELWQNHVDYVRDLYNTLCPGWVNVYQWIGDKRLMDHSMSGLCTGIEEETRAAAEGRLLCHDLYPRFMAPVCTVCQAEALVLLGVWTNDAGKAQ